MPYISASIVVQLMGIAIPYLQKLQKKEKAVVKKSLRSPGGSQLVSV
jgi:preprotein translocase subunit SecY